MLAVLNRQLGADFDLDAFEHVARYDAEAERMDIRLRSLADQDVRLDGLDLEIHFAAGEEMRTEISTKFTRERLEPSTPAPAWSCAAGSPTPPATTRSASPARAIDAASRLTRAPAPAG